LIQHERLRLIFPPPTEAAGYRVCVASVGGVVGLGQSKPLGKKLSSGYLATVPLKRNIALARE